MTLTGMVKRPRVWKLFDKWIDYEPAPLKSGLRVPFPGGNRRLTGSAFDYLFRMLAESRGAVSGSPWTAETRLKRSAKRDRNAVRRYVETAKRAALSLDGYPTEESARCSIILAKIDTLYRLKRKKAFHPFRAFSVMVDDITSMANIIPWKEFKTPMITAPVFGAAGKMVGGAAGDLLAGDVLIDVKTTANPMMTNSFINQLAGYYVLSRVCNMGVRRLGIYFARYGILQTFKAPSTRDPIFGDIMREFHLK